MAAILNVSKFQEFCNRQDINFFQTSFVNLTMISILFVHRFDIKVKPIEQGGKWSVLYQGCAENVIKSAEAVQKFIMSVQYGTEVCGKPGE